MTSSSLRIGVTELRRRPGNRADVRRVVILDGLSVSTAAVPDGAEAVVEVGLESLSDGVTARGTVTVPWEGECRRCLETTSGTLVAPIDEIYKDDPDEGETLPISGDAIELGQVVHDAVILGLPLAPLCRDDCAGPQPDQFPVSARDAEEADAEEGERPVDPRWAALEQLRFDSEAGE